MYSRTFTDLSMLSLCLITLSDSRTSSFFTDFVIHNEYGALLSDPPHERWPMEGRVGRALTSATGVACLRASGGVGPQLTSHVYGLLKAHGYESDPVAAGMGEGEEWISTAEGATWILGVVDKLVDALNEGQAAHVGSKL